MAKRTIFLDTSGLFAWVNKGDPNHEAMKRLPLEPGIRLILTDYIVDEACALFVARKVPHQRDRLLNLIRNSRIVSLEWIGQDLFWSAWDWMSQFADHPMSFTDCTSFACMKKLRLAEAATNDHHFQIAGFTPVLPLAG